jgi:ABC-2 type transport system permease protein
MIRVFSQVGKEIAQFRRDKLTLALAFFLPVMAILLYGYATRLESKNIPVAIKNYDAGSLSREYIDTIFANGQLTPSPFNGSDAMQPLDEGLAKASIIIPAEFSRHVKQGLPANIQVIVDATDVNNARVIKNSIIATSNYFSQTHDINHVQQLVKTEVRLWFNPGRDEALYVAPGAIAVVLWIFPCLLAALAMAREKEQGTVLQLYASSITSFELIAGKAMAYTIIALAQSVLIIGVSMILYGLRFVGDMVIFSLSLVLFLASAVLFGTFAGTRATTQSAAVQIVATTGFTTALLLSGFLYPLRNITYPLSLISTILPARYFVEESRNAFVRGSDFASQLYIPLALFGCAFVLYMAASRIMRAMQLKG